MGGVFVPVAILFVSLYNIIMDKRLQEEGLGEVCKLLAITEDEKLIQQFFCCLFTRIWVLLHNNPLRGWCFFGVISGAGVLLFYPDQCYNNNTMRAEYTASYGRMMQTDY